MKQKKISKGGGYDETAKPDIKGANRRIQKAPFSFIHTLSFFLALFFVGGIMASRFRTK